MDLIDNINRLLGDDLKQTIKPGARLKIAASCFSMYAFEALKAELEKVEELNFIFTSPTFVADEVTDKIRKERKEFNIPIDYINERFDFYKKMDDNPSMKNLIFQMMYKDYKNQQGGTALR